MTTPINNAESRKRGGRPRGSRNKRTVLAEKMFHGEAEQIIRSCIEGAKARDPVCMKLAVERICPAAKGRTVTFDMPEATTAQGIDQAMTSVLRAAATGKLTTDEAVGFIRALAAKSESIQVAALEKRIEAIEQSRNNLQRVGRAA